MKLAPDFSLKPFENSELELRSTHMKRERDLQAAHSNKDAMKKRIQLEISEVRRKMLNLPKFALNPKGPIPLNNETKKTGGRHQNKLTMFDMCMDTHLEQVDNARRAKKSSATT